jgi:pyrroloquinoline quinone biosynthesis protein D
MSLDMLSIPRLWRVARLDFDRVRQRHVLLYPEGAVFINDSGRAILELCDGHRTVAEIARVLGERYGVDVLGDVTAYLSRMIERGFVAVQAASPAGAA